MIRARQPRSARQVQTGFTVVELMISTLVFSMVLILITVGVLSFTKSYYQGINQSNTQDAARTIMEGIAQAIQFSGETVTTSPAGPNGSQGFCIGSQQYSYVLHRQLWDEGPPTGNQSRHALIIKRGPGCATIQAQDATAATLPGTTELLRPRMRLSKLSVTQVPATDTYRITIRVVYGDDDLLANLNTGQTRCDVRIKGSQYCAQSELTTVVRQRIAR